MIRGKMSVTSLRQIEVECVDGQWVAVGGNRRLYVLKKLHSRGKLRSPKIPVKLVTRPEDRQVVPTTLDRLRVRRGRHMWRELDDVIDGVAVVPDSTPSTSRCFTRSSGRLPAEPKRVDTRKQRHDIVVDGNPNDYQRSTNKRKKPKKW